MLRRVLPLLLLAGLLFLPASSVPGQDAARVDVIEITGHLDWAAVRFLDSRMDRAADARSEAAIIQLDSRASLSRDVHHLITRLADPPLPVAVWVGPAPAFAYGGAAHLLAAAPIRAAAPGARIGYAYPVVAGDSGSGGWRAAPGSGPPSSYGDRSAAVAGPVAGLVDFTAPSLNNLLVEMDGLTVTVRGEQVTLDTVRETPDGTAALPAVFSEPGLGTRVLRTAVGAEAAFFFLVTGLAVAAFEFYALGPGVAAGVAALCLLIAGYGLGSLPLRWWALALILAAVAAMTADFQRGRTGLLTVLGAGMMFAGGLFFTDAAPQIVPSWWITALITATVVAFYMFAMRTVARARFSTPAVGRQYLVGRTGRAVSPFSPDGAVEVDGARWRATAHREAGLSEGDPVVVEEVQGAFLAVAPAPPAAPVADEADGEAAEEADGEREENS